MPRVRNQRKPQQNLEVGALATPSTAQAGQHLAAGEEALGRAYEKTLSAGSDVADQILKVKAQNVASYEQTAEDGYMARVSEFERKSKLEGADGYSERMQKFLANEDRRVKRKLGVNPFGREVTARLDRDRATRLAQAKTWENTEILEQSRINLKSDMDKGLKFLSSVGGSYDKFALQVQEMNGGISERVGLSLSPDQAVRMSNRFEYAGAFASGSKSASDAGASLQQSWKTVEKSLQPYLAHFDNERDKQQFLHDTKSSFDAARSKIKAQLSKVKGKKMDDIFNDMGRGLTSLFDDPSVSPQDKAVELDNFKTSVSELIKEYPAKSSFLTAKRDQFIMSTVFPPLQEMLMQEDDPVAIAAMGKYIDSAFENTELSDRFRKYRERVETPTLTDVYSSDNSSKAAIYSRMYADIKPKGRGPGPKQRMEEMEGLKRYLGPSYPSNLVYSIYSLKKEAGNSLEGFKGLKPYKDLESIDPKFFTRLSLHSLQSPDNKDAKNQFLEDIQDPEKLFERMAAIIEQHGNSPDAAATIKALQIYGSEQFVRGLAIQAVNDSPEIQEYIKLRGR